MKDLAHHLKYLQKKVVTSSRKEVLANNSYETKSPLVNQAKITPNQIKRELHS